MPPDLIAISVVQRLCEGWHQLSQEDYEDIFAPDAVYVNMPRPTIERYGGIEAFEALLPWRTRCHIELQILHIRGDATLVMCERSEKFIRRSDGKTADFQVLGAFELYDGKITRWRDYYESAHSASATLLQP